MLPPITSPDTNLCSKGKITQQWLTVVHKNPQSLIILTEFPFCVVGLLHLQERPEGTKRCTEIQYFSDLLMIKPL